MAYARMKFQQHPNTTRFQEATHAWASMLNVSKAVVFKVAGNKRKKSPSWGKDRYYGRILPSEGDIAWMRVSAIDNEVSTDVAAAVIKLSACVKAMCYSCRSASVRAPVAPTCVDGSCPLRPVSPLKLERKAQ